MVRTQTAYRYSWRTRAGAGQFPVAGYTSSCGKSRQWKIERRWIEFKNFWGSGGISANQRAFARTNHYSLAARRNTVHARPMGWRMDGASALQCEREICQFRFEKISKFAFIQRHYR